MTVLTMALSSQHPVRPTFHLGESFHKLDAANSMHQRDFLPREVRDLSSGPQAPGEVVLAQNC